MLGLFDIGCGAAWQCTSCEHHLPAGAIQQTCPLLSAALPCSQGASPSQPVPWVHPADSSPAARAAREAHEHMHVPGGERTPLALAAAAGHAEAVAALRRRGAFLDLASLRHAGEMGG